MLGLKIITWSLVGSVFVTPLLFYPAAYLSFELPKILALYLFGGLCAYGLWVGNFQFRKSHFIIHAVYMLILWFIFASILGMSFEQSFWGNYFRKQGILTYLAYLSLFFAAGVAFRDRFNRFIVSLAVVASSAFVAILSLVQFISLWFLGNDWQLLYSGRVISTFGQPNFLGAYLVASLPFAWYLSHHYRKVNKYVIWGIILIICLAVFATLSRSAWIGFGFLLIIWGLASWKRLVLSLSSIMVFVVVLSLLLPNLFFQQFDRLDVDLGQEWTGENRGLIASKAIDLALKRPISGWGVDNFNLAFPTVITPTDFGLSDITVDSAHNIFLDLLVGSGIVGLGLFLWLVYLIFKEGFTEIRWFIASDKNFIKAMMCVGVVFLLSHQFSIVSSTPAILFWIAAGGMSGPLLEHRNYHTPPIKMLVMILSLELIVLFLIQSLRADSVFKTASNYEVSDIQRAIKLEEEASNMTPWVKHYQWRREFLLRQL